MNTPALCLLGAALFVAGGAAAQAPPPAPPRPNFVLIDGSVTAITADKLTIASKDGKSTTLTLSPVWFVVVARPVDMDAIKPGSFVATANIPQPNGDGKSIEMRMFEPGSKAGEGNYPWRVQGQMMTNGTVSRITKGANGRELDVTYPGGVRHIVVPPDIQLIASFPADRSIVKPGVEVQAAGVPGEGGALTATRISVKAKS